MAKIVNYEVDDDLKEIGEFGPYQFLIFVFVGLTSFIPAIVTYSYIFISGTPEYRCKLPQYDNDTFKINHDFHKQLVDVFVPNKIDGDRIEYDKCHLYNRNFSYMAFNNTNIADYYNNNTDKQSCNEWVFSKDYYGKTIVTDWKLLCDDTSKKSTYSMLYFIGSYGVLLIGIMSDKFGRKHTAYTFIIFNSIFSLLMAIILNLKSIELNHKQMSYSALRLLTGTTSNIYNICVVLAIEITGPSKRVVAANCIYYFYIIGEFVTVGICYFIRDYDKLYITFSIIMFLYVFYFWVVPESPRWSISKGYYKNAYKVLKRIAKANRKPIPERMKQLQNKERLSDTSVNDPLNDDETTENSNKVETKSPKTFLQTLSSIMRSRKLFIRTLSIIFNWITNNFVYYGITLGTGQLAGNPFLNFTLLAVIEMIAIICSQFAYQKFGRKVPYVLNMFVGAVSLLAIIFIPKSMSVLIVVMALIGKFTISFTFNGIYIITSEIYPTVIRSSIVSICQTFARLGSITSTQINLLGELYWFPIPFIIYGSFATVACLLTIFFIPESKDKKLPESFEDIDA